MVDKRKKRTADGELVSVKVDRKPKDDQQRRRRPIKRG